MAAIDGKKLSESVRALPPVGERLGPKDFEFRVASEADNDRCDGEERTKSEATSRRFLVMWICGTCEERSYKLKGTSEANAETSSSTA